MAQMIFTCSGISHKNCILQNKWLLRNRRLQRSAAISRSVRVVRQRFPWQQQWGQLTVPRLGTAKSGSESKAPMVSTKVLSSCDFVDEGDIAKDCDNVHG